MSAGKNTSSSKSTSASKNASASKKKKNLALVAGVAVVAALLGVASYTATKPEEPSVARAEKGSGDGASSAAPRAGVYPELEALARRDAKDPLAQGKADAPVVMVEYADFKCGFCGKFARDTEPKLVKKYVDDGTLRIEWRNFPIFGEDSERAARGAWAAGKQGKFWQFHEAAYADGAKEKGFGDGRLKELAREAGVGDVGRFMDDAGSDAAKAAVKKDQDEGYKLGATSTPSFVINGQPIAGAQPDAVFEQAIEAAAAAGGKGGSGGGKGGKGGSGGGK
ncbi:DsbA family protein [Streptomyces lasiicapitis]|uniref:DsbA family protein n=1 Tax=Streptomyces TaxID=1883 RepID=UPI0013DA593D|nr:DsbA family protein [Streptomyces aureoverticillatus]QIB44910.1 DsbA family protein [Streptomyces aureoverticillatus]